MNSDNAFSDIFKQDNKVIPKFDFWYLLVHAPKYTSTLLKWCTYPFVFLNVLGAFLLLYNDISKAIKYPDMGFGLFNLMIPSFGIGIALLLWIGLARDKQKKDAIQDFYIHFQQQYKKSPSNNIWHFYMGGPRELIEKVKKLSRGNTFAVIPKYSFEYRNIAYNMVVGDMIRTRVPTPAHKHGFSEELSYLLFYGLETTGQKKTVLTEWLEISGWFEKNLMIDIEPFNRNKFTLRYFNDMAVLEFQGVVWSPETKLEIGRFFEPSNKKEGSEAPEENFADKK